jgi:4-amino-4-deoxy-L-arabinose transferase-like glycosyltransferase
MPVILKLWSMKYALPSAAGLMGVLLAVSTLFAVNALVRMLDGLQSLMALLPVALAGICIWQIDRLRSNRHFLALAIILFILSRLAWVLLVPTEPVSDFATYHRFGEIFSHFSALPFRMRDQDINLTMQPWGYPFTLALLYAIVGQSLLAAKLLNVVVGVFTLWLLYKLGHQLGGPLAARVTSVLFLFWPAQLMFTSVLASEHLTLLALVAAFVALLSVNDESRKAVAMTLLTGALLGVGMTLRYPCLITLLTALACIVISNTSAAAKVWRASALLAGFFLIFGLYTVTMYAIYKQVPSVTSKFTFLAGTNYEARGTWSLEDGQAYSAFSTQEEADQYASATAIARIKRSPFRFFKLMGVKISDLWRDDSYAFIWSNMQLTANQDRVARYANALVTSSQFYYTCLLVAALAGSQLLYRRNGDEKILLLLATALSTTALHAVAITASRYHYVIMPTIMTLDSIFLIWLMKPATDTASGKTENQALM